jgi:hypothetical protein
VGIRAPRKTVVVFCEGRRTEPEYLEALRRDPAIKEVAAVDLRIDVQGSGCVPLTLVRRAVEARDRASRQEAEIDEFWCVFDVEWPKNHPDLTRAQELARNNNIRLAVSNPCFELWLILHFQDHRSWLDTNSARRIRRACDGCKDKGLPTKEYLTRRDVAVSRAAALDDMHGRDGKLLPKNNPSSGMYRLLKSIATPSDG